jgi:hypothetical protein
MRTSSHDRLWITLTLVVLSWFTLLAVAALLRRARRDNSSSTARTGRTSCRLCKWAPAEAAVISRRGAKNDWKS